MAGTWTPEGNVASTNVTKNSQLVTYSTKSLGGEKNQSIEALSIGGNLEATSNADWITNINIQTNTHDSTAKYYDVKFNVSANPTTTARTGAITFTYNSATATLNVTQERGDSPTSYTLYVYDPSNLNAHFSYYRVNGGQAREIPTGKTIQIYTYSASTESNTINVELQPKSTSIASKFGFVTNTASPDNNIVKYTNPTLDQQYTSHGFTSLSYNTGEGFGYATTNNNDSMWGSTVTADASTFIKLSHMSPYPPINIYISNKLYREEIHFMLYFIINNQTGDESSGFTFTDITLAITPLQIDISLPSIELIGGDFLNDSMEQTILTAHLEETFELSDRGSGEGKGYKELHYEPGTGGGRDFSTVYVELDSNNYSYQWCLNNPANPISITIH